MWYCEVVLLYKYKGLFLSKRKMYMEVMLMIFVKREVLDILKKLLRVKCNNI